MNIKPMGGADALQAEAIRPAQEISSSICTLQELDAAWLRVLGELGWASQLASTPTLRDALLQLSQVRSQTGLPTFSQILFR